MIRDALRVTISGLVVVAWLVCLVGSYTAFALMDDFNRRYVLLTIVVLVGGFIILRIIWG